MDHGMASFLRGRAAKGQEDSALAALLLSGVVDVDNPHEKNYLKMMLHDGNPRISWTTSSRIDKALSRLQGYAARDAFDYYRSGGHRVMSRPGALAQELTGIDDGRALDVFTNALAAELTKEGVKVTVVRGADITHYYNYKQHCKCVATGELASSCMRYDYSDHRFKMYEDAASLALILCDDCKGVRARTLLWGGETGKKYHDRVYGSAVAVRQIEAWAGIEGYEAIWGGRYAESSKGVRILLPEPASSYQSAPYLDTLFYWCRECNDLRTRRCRRRGHSPHVVKLRGTQGTDHEGWWGFCPTCNGVRNQHGECGRELYCQLCNASHCTGPHRNNRWVVTCPAGHVLCYACREARMPNDPCSCTSCNRCGHRYRGRDWAIAHGKCGECSYVQPNLNIPYARYQGDLHRVWLKSPGRGQCSYCGTTLRAGELKGHDARTCLGCKSLGWTEGEFVICPDCNRALLLNPEAMKEVGGARRRADPDGFDVEINRYLSAVNAWREQEGGVRIE